MATSWKLWQLSFINCHLTNLPKRYILLGMKINIFKCLRCSHEWASKQEHPRICPRCKSPYWDREPKASKYYVRVALPDHPHADKRGRVKRAVLVLEDKLGRFLEPTEEPHHINGVITDDRTENLELTTHQEHRRRENNLAEYNSKPRNTKGRPFYGNQYKSGTKPESRGY